MLSSAQIHGPAEANVHGHHQWKITMAGPPILLSKRDATVEKSLTFITIAPCAGQSGGQKGSALWRMANGVDISDVRGVEFTSMDDCV